MSFLSSCAPVTCAPCTRHPDLENHTGSPETKIPTVSPFTFHTDTRTPSTLPQHRPQSSGHITFMPSFLPQRQRTTPPQHELHTLLLSALPALILPSRPGQLRHLLGI